MIGLNIGLRKFSGTTLSNGGTPTPPPLSNDTSLSIFTVDGNSVSDNDTINFTNGTMSVTVVAVPTHPSATVGAISGDSGLVTGDNALTFDVTAEDGVTVQTYHITLHVLTVGVSEVTEINATGFFNTGADLASGSDGYGIIISNGTERRGFWFNTSTETQPDFSSLGAIIYTEVGVNIGDTNAACMISLAGALNANGFTCDITLAPKIIVTDNAFGLRTDAVEDGSLRFAITITTQGSDQV